MSGDHSKMKVKKAHKVYFSLYFGPIVWALKDLVSYFKDFLFRHLP